MKLKTSQNNQFNIRKAVTEDIPSLVRYNGALAKETEDLNLDPAVLTKGVTKVLNNPSLGQYFVAELNGEVLGQTLITYEWSDWRAGMFWWLQSVYVHPDHRSKGVFRAIYNHIEETATKQPDVRGLRLYVMRHNQVGMKVYQKLSMENSGYIVYEKDFT